MPLSRPIELHNILSLQMQNITNNIKHVLQNRCRCQTDMVSNVMVRGGAFAPSLQLSLWIQVA